LKGDVEHVTKETPTPKDSSIIGGLIVCLIEEISKKIRMQRRHIDIPIRMEKSGANKGIHDDGENDGQDENPNRIMRPEASIDNKKDGVD
jgi:hypothetical protein